MNYAKEPSELPWSQTVLFLLNSMLRRSLPLRSPVLWSSAQDSCSAHCRPLPARAGRGRGQSRSAGRDSSARSRAGRSKGDCCTRTYPRSTRAERESPAHAGRRRSRASGTASEGSPAPARRPDRRTPASRPRGSRCRS